jgi:feruloyl esterase
MINVFSPAYIFSTLPRLCAEPSVDPPGYADTMIRNLTSIFLLLLPFTITNAATSPSFRDACLSFNPTSHLTNTTVRLHEHIPGNTTVRFPGSDVTCGRPSQLFTNEACRIALTIPTTNRSSIIFELFLPTQAAWTGRFLGTGNGGIDGCIKYEDIAYGLNYGFATSGSNNGHNGTGGKEFLNNPDIVIDFSWRAKHTAAEAGKKLIAAFYGMPHTKSYYLGCSGGGRQGVQAASLFPKDYDGIVVGAPALNFNYMSAWRASFYTITGSANSSDFIKPAVWQGLIHSEILRQCDELDGVKDGILVEPKLCAAIFRPEVLLCARNQTTDCLSSTQVEMVRKVFSPLYGEDGEMIYPGLAPGGEARATGGLLSGTPFPYSVDWFRYAVYSNPSWDPAHFTIADAQVAEEKNPGNARTWPDTLAPLRDAEHKLLIYHGGADYQITGLDTERWYDYLSRMMGARSQELDDFVRFFRIPGMGHCSGGNGAWQVGQSLASAVGIPYDAEQNVLKALIEWVENGRAPDSMLGTKFVNDTASNGVELRRRHCRSAHSFRLKLKPKY